MIRAPILLLLCVAALACAKRPAPAPDPRVAQCRGDLVVIVSNNWTQSIDVYSGARDQTAPIVIGSVRPGGRDELVLPLGSVYAYVRASEPTAGGYRPMPPTNRVQLRYRCRE